MKPCRGHSLLEAILAAVLFSIVAVFLMGIWEMQFRGMLKSKETVVASFLAERVMEECVAAGFDRVELLYPEKVELQVRSRTRAGERTASYSASVRVTPHPSDVEQKFVSVTVTFRDSTGESKVAYHTAVHRNQ